MKASSAPKTKRGKKKKKVKKKVPVISLITKILKDVTKRETIKKDITKRETVNSWKP